YSPGPLLLKLQNWKEKGTTGRKRSSLDPDLFGRSMCANVHSCPALFLKLGLSVDPRGMETRRIPCRCFQLRSGPSNEPAFCQNVRVACRDHPSCGDVAVLLTLHYGTTHQSIDSTARC